MTKNIYFIILLAFTSLLSLSCEEDFSPKGELKDKYILSCILRSDTTFQTAFLSESYAIEGYDPYTYKIDPAVKNAEIRVWETDSVHLFKSGSFLRTDTSRYNLPGSFYYSNFMPKTSQSVEIEALMSNGKRLKGFTRLPIPVDKDYILTDTIIPPVNKNSVLAAWKIKEQFLFYIPIFKIIYFKKVNGIEVRCEKPIASGYRNNGLKDIPVYPSATGNMLYSYDMEAISRAMKEISEADADKGNYRVLSLMVDVYILDRNLSAFYSSGKLHTDGFSITVDQADFTNIDGGLGIFGSYTKKSFPILFDKKYIESFGYKPGLP